MNQRAVDPDFVQSPGAIAMRSPLHGLMSAPASARAKVQVAELKHLAYVVLRGKADDAAFMQGVQNVLGTPLPTLPMTLLNTPRGAVLWQSPDEWLLVLRRSERAGTIEALSTALYGVFAQVVDVSGGFALLRLAGPEHQRVLHHLGPCDFARLGVGQGVGTVMSKASVTVLRTDTDGVLLLFRRSFADYVWRLVERATRPYGLAIRSARELSDPTFTSLLDGV